MAKTRQTDAREPGRYKWVPAAILYARDGGTGIYIKYGKYPNRVVLKERGPGYMWIQCPDRELVVTTNQHHFLSYRPMEGTYDEYIHLGVFHDDLMRDLDLEFMMVNYTADIGKEHRSHQTRNLRLPHNTKIISDSGGFQLFQQRYDYLDPLEIVKWYNSNCDIGLVLDIPTNLPGYYDRLAQVQKRNTQVMLDNKADTLELMNIIHGSSREQRDRFRSVVECDEIDRLALGGIYSGTILNTIDNLYSELHTGKKYKHYHVLGVSNPLQIMLIMRMASKGFAELITSDSSTFLQNAVVRQYHVHPMIQENPRFSIAGDGGGYKPSGLAELPCNCPVCSSVKYADVLFGINGNQPIQLVLYHNLYAMKRYFDVMWEQCSTLPTDELKELLKMQLGGSRSGYTEMIRGLDYIDYLEEHGQAKAQQAFAYYLSSLMIRSQSPEVSDSRAPGVLFDDDGSLAGTSEYVAEEEEEESSGTDPEEAFNAILNRYEQAAQTDVKHGAKNKEIKTGRIGLSIAVAKKGPGKMTIKRTRDVKRKSNDAGDTEAS